MEASHWIALGTLLFAIASGGATVIVVLFNNKNAILDRLQANKEALGEELDAIRMAAYEEYKTLRKEMQDGADVARREFGETVRSAKEKVASFELWTRDALQETRASLYRKIDEQRIELDTKISRVEERVRQLELFTAREMGRKELV